MGYYSIQDNLSASLKSFSMKYFENNIESLKIDKLIDNVSVKTDTINGDGVFNAVATTDNGVMNLKIHVIQWAGDNQPVIIYFPSEMENPPTKSAEATFLTKKHHFNANVIVVEPPFSGSSAEYKTAVADIAVYLNMFAACVATAEEIIQHFRKKLKLKIIVCGIGQGGWITNLHNALFDSAGVYIPMFAGTGLGNYFVDSSYRKTISSLAKRHAAYVRNLLNFDDIFMARGRHVNSFPLLAMFDQYALFVRQQTSYGDIPIKVIKKGHVAGLKAVNHIRKHIVEVMEKNKK